MFASNFLLLVYLSADGQHSSLNRLQQSTYMYMCTLTPTTCTCNCCVAPRAEQGPKILCRVHKCNRTARLYIEILILDLAAI